MRRWCVWTLVIAACLSLTGCDPHGVPEQSDRAVLAYSVTADGGAQAELFLGGDQPEQNLLRAGQAVSVAPALFPGDLHPVVKLNDNGGGYPFVVISASHVYEPGTQAQLSLDFGGALTVLAEQGFRTVDVDVSGPRVPTTATWTRSPDITYETSWYWEALKPTDAPPTGTIRFAPRPWRGIGELVLTGVALISVIFGFGALRLRRRRLAGAGAGAALAAASTVVLTAGGVQGDNLGVVGWVSGRALSLLTALPMLSLLIGMAAVGLAIANVLVAVSQRTVFRFNSPPGWPLPPPGWSPPPGWAPDPDWPTAPPGWAFFIKK